MRINLPGIAKVRAKGRTYYYAWRSGPRLVGQPGSPEFLASYEAAHRTRRDPSPTLLHSIIAGYKASRDFTKLRDRTKVDYLRSIKRIEADFGDLPLTALEDPRVSREFLNWRDKMAATPRTADAHWTVLMLILAWGRQGGLTTYRAPERVERLYRGDRSDMIWSEADVGAFLAKAPETLRRAMMLALYTGQRQGDLLALTWTAYDGQVIRLRQSKGGVRVVIPVHTRLRATLDALPRVSTHILTNAQHRPWRQESFRKVWLDASRAAGIEGLHFHDLRGTAVTRLAEAHCTVPEIAALTGHSLKHASTIVERYMKRTDKLAEAAIFKLERGGQ